MTALLIILIGVLLICGYLMNEEHQVTKRKLNAARLDLRDEVHRRMEAEERAYKAEGRVATHRGQIGWLGGRSW